MHVLLATHKNDEIASWIRYLKLESVTDAYARAFMINSFVKGAHPGAA